MAVISLMRAWRWAALVLVGAILSVPSASGQDNLVANGSFTSDDDRNGVPDNWATSGTAEIKQTLGVDDGPEGTKAARLVCTRFVSDSPASHAMICQTGHVAVQAGRWYRLSWRAKAQDMPVNVVQVALSNTRQWSNTGLSYSFPVSGTWRE